MENQALIGFGDWFGSLFHVYFICQIVSTNLVGSLLCTREAMHVMESQEKGGHVFNMDGAGSGGSSTPLTAV